MLTIIKNNLLCIKSTILVLIASIVLSLNVYAQENENVFIERYPIYLQLRVEGKDPASMVEGMELNSEKDKAQFFWLYDSARRWEPGEKLKVCFIGGSPALNASVAQTANVLTLIANIEFDFGNISNPNVCNNRDTSEIRISYRDIGSWSLIGSQSTDLRIVNYGEPTMNIDALLVDQPNSDYFKMAVLHEFCHALGLMHEHQNPKTGCEDEIIWAGPRNIYTYYGASPYFLDRETINLNFRSIEHYSVSAYDEKLDPRFSEPDFQSIMFYQIPSVVLKAGPQSKCYRKNIKISKRDAEVLAVLYPRDTKAATDIILGRISAFNNVVNHFEFDLTKESHLIAKDYFKVKQAELLTKVNTEGDFRILTDVTVTEQPKFNIDQELQNAVMEEILLEPGKYGVDVQ